MRKHPDLAELSEHIVESKILFHHWLCHKIFTRNNVLSVWYIICDEDTSCIQ